MTRPNIVFLLTDDQGPWAVPWLMPELQMPNLASMAQRGTTFNNFYCASPVCSPARASLLTGRMPSGHGIHDWLIGERHPQAHPDEYLEDVTTLPAVLAGAGYTCALAGKWHVGDSRRPAAGYTSWYAHRYGGGPYYDAPIWSENGEATTEPEYFTTAVSRQAVDFIRSYNNDAPFFLHICTTAPHDPWDENNHPDDLLDLYTDCEFPSVPRPERHPWTTPRKTDFEEAFNDPQTSLKGYCASLTGVDRLLGEVRQALAEKGLEENTVLIYMADNGFSCGHHGVWGKGNGTYPLNFWENSVRVPLVIEIPPALADQINLPDEVDDHVSALSFFPTVCDIAGVTAPADPRRVGQSLVAQGQYRQPDAPVAVYDEYGGGRMIRYQQWKYITRYEGPTELYDLKQDPNEETNLAGQPDYAAIETQLHERLQTWFATVTTPQHDAWEQPVRGFGQIHPNWRSRGEAAYEQGNVSRDGVR